MKRKTIQTIRRNQAIKRNLIEAANAAMIGVFIVLALTAYFSFAMRF